jgi:hypothetical protein
MRSWLMYWRSNTDRSGILDHAASDQLGKVAVSDEVWFVTIDDGELILFGHMLVGSVMSQSEAEAILGKGLWEAKYHIVPNGKPEPFGNVPIADIARDLRFQGGVSQLPREYSGQNLQTMRALTTESAKMLRRKWTQNVDSSRR